MTEAARLLSSFGTEAAGFIWLPLLIWTLLVSMTLLVLHYQNKLHVQYHYHLRLALLLSLPVGLLLTGITELAAGWIYAADDAVTVKFIVVQAPVEVTAMTADQHNWWLSSNFWYGFLTIIFIAGTLGLTTRYLLQYIRLSLLSKQLNVHPIHRVREITENNLALAESCKYEVGLAFLNRSLIPVTYGVQKPVILLPAELTENPEKLNLVVRHELMHIKNHDFLMQLWMSGIRALFWFHPLVHLLYKQLVDYREFRCDCHVLSDQSVSRKMYASLLLELLPLSNLNRNVSVNMAQESSNLKKRIDMMKTENIRSIPLKTSLSLFCCAIAGIVIVMSCTDMQQHNVFDEEELDLMTDFDQTGERDHQKIIIYMSDEQQIVENESSMSRLEALQPEHIESINILKGEAAVEEYGSRGAQGVIEIRTRQDLDSYNRALRALGMEPFESPPAPPHPDESPDDGVFTVVEQMPELIGGLASVQRNIRYPETARRAGIEGRVYVQFIVNEEGEVEQPRVIRGIGGGCDEAALEAVKQVQFRPGMQRGEPVRVQYSLPIVFRLAGDTPDEQSDMSEHNSGFEAPDQNTIELPEFTVVGYTSRDPDLRNLGPERVSDQGFQSIRDASPIALVNDPEVQYKTFEIRNFQRNSERISGRISDRETGQPLAGANIYIENTNISTATNLDGDFVIENIPGENFSLQISYVGYEKVRIDF